ncbi:MAG: DUF5060 domain-containing protein [Cytophagales bacterium]|nr:DUF5060 domain-containing protein [Armatimonadota bacterium]
MRSIFQSRRILWIPLAFALCLMALWGRGGMVRGETMTYPHIEASFPLPGITGNPFDYTENDVAVTFQGPKGKAVTVPAFYDGGADSATWRARYTPQTPGKYTLARITRNGAAVPLAGVGTRTFTVAKDAIARSGFIRRDQKNPRRFVYDNGETYYPIGHNAAWGGQGIELTAVLTKMGAVGENWSRIWMNHWDGKNLDWSEAKNPPGTLDLAVARKWDAIVAAAEKSRVPFQMVLQHHGQYSSTVNSNWGDNPWNAKNRGGFLQKPEEFFTDPRARALTRAKYRYIISRWGYSPGVLAWELFNEVQFTDALRNKTPEGRDSVVAWHKEMAAFIRVSDPAHHLVTTSSDTDIAGLYDAVDYVQPHSYPPDAITMAASLEPEKWDKPIFFGEVGPSGGDGRLAGSSYKEFLHAALWASLMRGETGGAAQFWYWDQVEKEDLYGQYQSATDFLKETRLASFGQMKDLVPVVATAESGEVAFGPGGGWGAAKQTEFVISPDGSAPGAANLPSYLQGKNHAALFSAATFQVDYARPGTFAVLVGQYAKAGAHLVLSVDGKTAAEREFPAAAQDADARVTVTAPVPAGKHTIRLSNSGTDWVVLSRITLAPYGAAVKAAAKGNGSRAALWIYRVAPGTDGGTITLPAGALKPGRYRVRWWDTEAGRERTRDTVTVAPGNTRAVLKAPPVEKDLAAFVEPV